jgi:hypothetical protein
MKSDKAKWRVVIADAPHREDLFAEIWINSEHLGEVFVENGEAYIEIFPPTGDSYHFEYTILLTVIEEVNKFLESISTSNDDSASKSHL